MRAFVLFTSEYLEWPLAICRALQAADPGIRILGLAAGPENMAIRLANDEMVAAGALDHLDALERCWISSPARPDARATYTAMLGDDIFQRLTIADSHLGRGFISGGKTPQSPLARLVEDPEILERYLIGLLDYIFERLGRSRPDLVFCFSVATAPALALALGAQHLGIAFAQLRHTRIGDRMILDTAPYDRLEPVREHFERYALTNSASAASLRQAEDYLTALRDGSSVPDYLAYHTHRIRKALRPLGQVERLLCGVVEQLRDALDGSRQELRRPAPLVDAWHEFCVFLGARQLLRRGPFRPVGWRPVGPFAFFPLHVDPEHSTMVQSPLHTDQLAVVEAIAKQLPCGMNLLVKEHIPMLGRRPAGFYKRLGGIPGVELVSPFEQGGTLVGEATLTTVISSTAGWEAIVHGHPALVIAFPPYAMVNDGFVAQPDLTRLGAAMRTALQAGPADERRLLAYIAAVLDCSFTCPTRILWDKVTPSAIEANPAILSEITDRLRALVLQEPSTLQQIS